MRPEQHMPEEAQPELPVSLELEPKAEETGEKLDDVADTSWAAAQDVEMVLRGDPIPGTGKKKRRKHKRPRGYQIWGPRTGHKKPPHTYGQKKKGTDTPPENK